MSAKICPPRLMKKCDYASAKKDQKRASGWSTNEHALEPERLARTARIICRRNQACSGDGGCFQASRHPRDQKSPRFARENAGEFLYRTQHAYTHVIRAGSGSTERGCDQYHGLCLEPEQG